MPEFLAAIERIHDDRQVRCVILTGNGPSLCAGGDIRHDYRRGIQRVALGLFNLEVPLIAAINGHAIGAGLDLACMCDIRIASEKAKMAASFIKVGIIPGEGGAWRLLREAMRSPLKTVLDPSAVFQAVCRRPITSRPSMRSWRNARRVSVDGLAHATVG